MKIDSIVNGIVLDHITCGKVMDVYDALELDKLDCSIAILKNVRSTKMGRKDILKIDNDFDVDLDVLGYIDPSITVSIIRDGKTVEKKHLQLPGRIKRIERCRNPRCITAAEPQLVPEFYLASREKRIYRCIYCDTAVGRKDK